MLVPNETCKNFSDLIAAWRDAEEAIKIAEQVSGNVDIPAIKELRYAGRKIVTQALDILLQGGSTHEVDAFIRDAIFDCYRARHDASDTAITAIGRHLSLALDQFSHEDVSKAFPDFARLWSQLANARRMVVGARRNRGNQQEFYCELERDALPELISSYNAFVANEIFMKRSKIVRMLKSGFAIIGWIMAAGAAVFAALSYFSA